MISLNPKFTIPNFPSRLTSYLEVGLPVIACTDKISDIGDIIVSEGCGFKILSGNIREFKDTIHYALNSPEMIKTKSVNSRNLFEKSFTINQSYQIIMNRWYPSQIDR